MRSSWHASYQQADGCSAEEAFEAVRRRTVFTTHTPVPAGNDTYPAEQVAGMLAGIAGEMGVDVDELVRRGRTHPDELGEPFGVTQFALRSSRIANGVSARHGEVAREMWRDLWPDRAARGGADRPRHQRRAHPDLDRRADARRCSTAISAEGWQERAVDPATWDGVDEIPDEELWAARSAQRRELIELVRARSVTERLARGDTPEYVRAAAAASTPTC